MNRKVLIIAAAFVLAGGALSALDVAEDELERTAGEQIEFINYEGPVSVSESVSAIAAIGRFLGSDPLEEGAMRDYFAHYRIIRAVDPSTPEGLDADIFVVLENARVDHIRNLRLMLSGYLREAYGYSEAAGGLVAELATVYNAVFRGNIENFEERYKPVVLDHLSEEQVGLSTVYRDWPGNTQIVIPLRSGRALVDPFVLADDAVIGDLRERDDMGIAERRALVTLMEDLMDLEREELVDDQERLIADLSDLERRELELLEERRRLDELDDEERASAEQRIALLEAQLSERAAELTRRADEIADRDEEIADLDERVQEERDRIAEDQDEITDDEDIDIADDGVADDDEIAALPDDQEIDDRPTELVLEVTGQPNGVRSTLTRIFTDTGEIDSRSEIDEIATRRFVEFDGHLILTRFTDDDRGVLQQIDTTSFEVVSEAAEIVFARTAVETAGEDAYVVIRTADEWRLGRYTAGLTLESETGFQVNPYTFIVVRPEYLILQDSEGTFRIVEPITLEEFE